MFDEFLKKCPMEDKIKPSRKRVQKNLAALGRLIEEEESSMTARKKRIKPIMIAAITAVISAVTILTVYAASHGILVKFFMGGKEMEGTYHDYVDGDGFRHITFSAELPAEESNFVVIYDVDKPLGENVRVITDETDPDFFEKLCAYCGIPGEVFENWKKGIPDPDFLKRSDDRQRLTPEECGLVLKDSEIGMYRMGVRSRESISGFLGGDFMRDNNDPKPSGASSGAERNDENGTMSWTFSFYYYVGKDKKPLRTEADESLDSDGNSYPCCEAENDIWQNAPEG